MPTPRKSRDKAECVFERPLYYSAEAARLAKISVYRVHRWLEGYEYTYEEERIKRPPVLKIRKKQVLHPNYASFYDLIDLLFVKRFLDYGLSLQKIRRAFREAEELLETTHFAHQIFFTDGKNICLQMRGKGEAILELLSDGQWVISDVIKQLTHEIIFDQVSQTALRWFPLEGNRLVVLDPCVAFGRPSIVQKGIITENIYDLYRAEGSNVEAVGNWMSLKPEEVEAAVKFETHLAA